MVPPWVRTTLASLAFVFMFAAVASGSEVVSVVPRVGIGVVRLNETQTAVEQALGHGQPVRHGVYAGYIAYHAGTAVIDVDYTGGRVDGVDTSSRSILIYGRPLSRGLTKLEPLFRSHKWTVLSCDGETYTDLGQGGPGSGIAWRHGALDYVQIDPGGSIGDACEPEP